MQKDNQINACQHDMATAINGVGEFNENDGDNVDIWIRDIIMIANLSGYNEGETIRAITLKLRGTALAWASELLESKQWRITLDDFVSCLKKRFGNLNHTELSLAKFLMTPIPTTREEFSELLKSGTTLYERKLLTTFALTDVLLTKSPDSIKPLLLLAAEQVAFLAFPDKMLNRITTGQNAYCNSNTRYYDRPNIDAKYDSMPNNRNRYNNKPNFNTKYDKFNNRTDTNRNNNVNNRYSNNSTRTLNERTSTVRYNRNQSTNQGPYCEAHGHKGHTSAECRTLKYLLNRGWSRSNSVRRVETEDLGTKSQKIQQNTINPISFTLSMQFLQTIRSL
ncbi:hypothetical protein NGRA_2339 [Nosema granulosis]|uniref:Uncharacterized protein n=1 Tax=Nosema granulosis TaxID=83296 RepID=A0A9P6KYR5_9MICR|nr:hypothetical protein NGRA_2339 [Nosema granulosis]